MIDMHLPVHLMELCRYHIGATLITYCDPRMCVVHLIHMIHHRVCV